MVSFVCDECQDTIKKPKLESHAARCRASFTCIDCNVTFYGREWQGHTQCISEEQKYQKGFMNGKGRGGQAGKKAPQPQQATSTPSARPELPAKQPIVPESTKTGNVKVQQSKKELKKELTKEKKRKDTVKFSETGPEKVKKEKDGKVKKQKKAKNETDKKEKKERKAMKDRKLDDAPLQKESVVSETPANGTSDDTSKKKKVKSKGAKAESSEKSHDKKKKRKASEMEDSEPKPRKKKSKIETNGEPAALP